MRPNPNNWSIVALLLALLMPLQSFAAISGCAPPSAAQHGAHQVQAHEHCAQHPSQDLALQHQHHACGDCCIAAVGQTLLDWIAPRSETPQLSLPELCDPLMISLDRLDRPPRTPPV